MEERKDTAFKLFGKTIRPWTGRESPADLGEVAGVDTEKETSPEIRNRELEACTHLEKEDEEEKTEVNDSIIINSPEKSHKSIKSPPCPRCKSKATKFCYYNNYSINQPRHFCRNCLRYWTSGGVMRNLPVGSGRRKIKSPSNVAIIPGELQHPQKTNETVLSFDSDETLPTLKNRSHNRENQVPYINGAPCSHPWTAPIHLYPPTVYWSIPWLSQPSPSSTSSCSVLNSTLKHSRAGEMSKHGISDKEDALGSNFLKVMYADPVAR